MRMAFRILICEATQELMPDTLYAFPYGRHCAAQEPMDNYGCDMSLQKLLCHLRATPNLGHVISFLDSARK